MILLDSSVLADLPRLQLPETARALSIVAYAEMAFGVTSARDPIERSRRQAHLVWLESLGMDWLPFDRAAADGYAALAAVVNRARPAHARSKDIMIAGHAYALGAALATLNPRDFDLVKDLVPIVTPARCN